MQMQADWLMIYSVGANVVMIRARDYHIDWLLGGCDTPETNQHRSHPPTTWLMMDQLFSSAKNGHPYTGQGAQRRNGSIFTEPITRLESEPLKHTARLGGLTKSHTRKPVVIAYLGSRHSAEFAPDWVGEPEGDVDYRELLRNAGVDVPTVDDSDSMDDVADDGGSMDDAADGGVDGCCC